MEHVSIGIITFNEKGNIYLANTAARNLLNHEHLTHINQISRVDRKLFLAIKELQPGDRKLVSFNGKTGVVQLSLKSTLFKTAQQNFQLVAIQDIKNEMETVEVLFHGVFVFGVNDFIRTEPQSIFHFVK